MPSQELGDIMASVSENGINITGLAWLTLIVLKAMGHLTLSWGWVILFPIWFPIALGIATVGASIVIFLVVFIIVVVFGTIYQLCGGNL